MRVSLFWGHSLEMYHSSLPSTPLFSCTFIFFSFFFILYLLLYVLSTVTMTIKSCSVSFIRFYTPHSLPWWPRNAVNIVGPVWADEDAVQCIMQHTLPRGISTRRSRQPLWCSLAVDRVLRGHRQTSALPLPRRARCDRRNTWLLTHWSRTASRSTTSWSESHSLVKYNSVFVTMLQHTAKSLQTHWTTIMQVYTHTSIVHLSPSMQTAGRRSNLFLSEGRQNNVRDYYLNHHHHRHPIK